jgi:Zn-dependent peptidase ImmA (M78 family)
VAVAEGIGYKVDLVALRGSRNGDCNFDSQLIRVRESLAPAQAIKTLAHELGHALLHNPRNGHVLDDRGLAELEAESVAYVVCDGLDIDSSAYSFG